MSEKTRYRIEAECPDCGCGLIQHMAPDVWREKYGDGKIVPDATCPGCGMKLVSRVSGEEVPEEG